MSDIDAGSAAIPTEAFVVAFREPPFAFVGVYAWARITFAVVLAKFAVIVSVAAHAFVTFRHAHAEMVVPALAAPRPALYSRRRVYVLPLVSVTDVTSVVSAPCVVFVLSRAISTTITSPATGRYVSWAPVAMEVPATLFWPTAVMFVRAVHVIRAPY